MLTELLAAATIATASLSPARAERAMTDAVALAFGGFTERRARIASSCRPVARKRAHCTARYRGDRLRVRVRGTVVDAPDDYYVYLYGLQVLKDR